MFLIQKYTQYKAAQAEQQKRKVTEKELAQLNHKIDKLLTKLDEHEPELASNQDEECVVCVNAKATMQTYPCGHRVVCRKCFVKTIQTAVTQRRLPLRCVMCRAKILRLKHTVAGGVHSSASQDSINGGEWYHVPQSASLYSVTSSTSGVSGVSSATASSCSSASSYKTCSSNFSSASIKSKQSYSSYSKMGYQPLRTSSPSPSRSPNTRVSSASSSNSHTSMMTKRDNKVCPVVQTPASGLNQHQNGKEMPKGKLTLIREFQREYRNGREQSQHERKFAASNNGGNVIGGTAYKPGSTRIKCARHLVSQASADMSLPTANAHSSGITSASSSKATTPTSTSGKSFMRKSESINGAPSSSSAAASSSNTGISRSKSMAAGTSAALSVKRTSSYHNSEQRAITPTSPMAISQNQSPSAASCPSSRLSRVESKSIPIRTASPETSDASTALLTNCISESASGASGESRRISSRESRFGAGSREILSASSLTVRFGGAAGVRRINEESPNSTPMCKSRTPTCSGAGVAGAPLLRN